VEAKECRGIAIVSQFFKAPGHIVIRAVLGNSGAKEDYGSDDCQYTGENREPHL
jgi:hypothetical protein